jgi:hypothetical protein
MNEQATLDRTDDQTRPAQAGPTFIEYVEQYRCPHCESVIHADAVVGNIQRDDQGRTMRQIRIWCDHCEALYEALMRVNGERLSVEQPPTRVTDRKTLALFSHRLAHLRGDKFVTRPKAAAQAC